MPIEKTYRLKAEAEDGANAEAETKERTAMAVCEGGCCL